MIRDEAGQEQRAEERDLIRLHDHQARRNTGGKSIAGRRAVERAREQPERNRQEYEALDLADMLDAPRRGSAEHEGKRCNDTARRMPAAVVEEHQHRKPRLRQQQQHRNIERMEARMRHEQREQN